MVLTWWAVGTWGATALGGLTMAALFVRHHGMRQSERDAIGPLRVFPHVIAAVAGYGLWVAYAVTDTDALGWAGMCLIAIAFLIAGTFMLTRDQHRRAELTRAAPAIAGGAAGAPAAPPSVGAAAIPAEKFIPIWLAGAHGLLGAATLVLVLLQRAGVS
ncbi:MAG: hypothetical protein ACRDMX_01115 [Solirubrobacteraceae bacterium]